MTSHGMLGALVAALLVIVLESVVLHLAAGLVTRRPAFRQAVLTAIVGGLSASLVAAFVPGPRWMGLAVAVLVWVAIASVFYRIGWARALMLGVVAWILFVGLTLLVDAVAAAVA